MKFNETKSQERLINLMLQAGVEWPDGAKYATTNSGGVIGFCVRRPSYSPYFGLWSGDWIETRQCEIGVKTFPNWHQTIITREQYEARDGWITWHGGECPVGDDVKVEVMLRRGGDQGASLGCSWAWDSEQTNKITAYRIHKEQPASEPCESVKACIPDRPTIEQLIAEWQQAKQSQDDELNDLNKQQAVYDAARAVTDAAHRRVEDKLAEIGWIEAAQPDPEQLMINDWRDLRVGDEVKCVGEILGTKVQVGDVGKISKIGNLGVDIIFEKYKHSSQDGSVFNCDASSVKFIRRPNL